MTNATLVIHFNAFTGKLLGGYKLVAGRKDSAMLLPADILAIMAACPDIRCSPQMV